MKYKNTFCDTLIKNLHEFHFFDKNNFFQKAVKNGTEQNISNLVFSFKFLAKTFSTDFENKVNM